MSISNDVKAVLEASGSLTTVLTGGIYDYEETGFMGINFTKTPGAYNGALLKPCAMVRARREYPTFEIRDPAAQAASYVQAIEIWVYEASGFDNIESAASLIYALLHDKRFSFGYFHAAGTRGQGPAEELSGASSDRLDFQRFFIRQV